MTNQTKPLVVCESIAGASWICIHSCNFTVGITIVLIYCLIKKWSGACFLSVRIKKWSLNNNLLKTPGLGQPRESWNKVIPKQTNALFYQSNTDSIWQPLDLSAPLMHSDDPTETPCSRLPALWLNPTVTPNPWVQDPQRHSWNGSTSWLTDSSQLCQGSGLREKNMINMFNRLQEYSR